MRISHQISYPDSDQYGSLFCFGFDFFVMCSAPCLNLISFNLLRRRATLYLLFLSNLSLFGYLGNVTDRHWHEYIRKNRCLDAAFVVWHADSNCNRPP